MLIAARGAVVTRRQDWRRDALAGIGRLDKARAGLGVGVAIGADVVDAAQQVIAGVEAGTRVIGIDGSNQASLVRIRAGLVASGCCVHDHVAQANRKNIPKPSGTHFADHSASCSNRDSNHMEARIQ